MRHFLSHRPQLLPLLQAAAQRRQDLELATFTEAQVRWVLATGLGPLLFQVTQGDPRAPASPCWPLLRAAELTARVLTAEHFEAMSEILEASTGHIAPVVLLKGISVAEQYYPAPHLRPMRDIDLLVTEADLPAMEALLFALGYAQPPKPSPQAGYRHHHLSPFFHPRRGIWIEVHWRLFSSLSPFETDPVFSPDHLATQLRPSTFQGRPVMRFSDELQLVYLAAHWHRSYNLLTPVGAMIAMVDLIYLLGNSKTALHWEQILEWRQGSAAGLPLYLLLTYLQRCHLLEVEAAVLRELSLRHRALSRPILTMLHALIDRYIVDGCSPGPLVSARTLSVLWQRLRLPGLPWRNLLGLPWYFLPSRAGIRERLSGLHSRPDSTEQ
jgi:Uncharacterised nucleotidyltransferase